MEISIIFLFYILYIFLILQILAKSFSSAADVKNQACFINYICSRILMNNSNYL